MSTEPLVAPVWSYEVPEFKDAVTVGDTVRRMRQLCAVYSDDGMLHKMEDAIYRNVLEAIAQGQMTNPRDAAHRALQASDIPFDRWYA